MPRPKRTHNALVGLTFLTLVALALVPEARCGPSAWLIMSNCTEMQRCFPDAMAWRGR
jgi:hypothetical protein